MLRERKKLNQSGSILGALAVIGGIGLLVAVTQENEWLYNAMRFIFLLLDSAVYTIAGWAYSIFYEVSYNSILSSLNLSTAAQRLYTLLGIFMLFRLAFAFVKYIINPDGMEKGSGKLMTNLAVSLALIVSTPWIFNRAFELQTYIMDSNVIGNLIMGMNTNTAEDDNFNAGSYGQVISFLTFGAFYHPESSIPAISSCGNLLNYYSEYVEISTSEGRDILVVPDSTPQEYRKDAEKIAACVNELNGRGDTADSTLAGNSVEIGTRFFIASQRYNMGLITHSGVYKATIGETHVISYTPIVSTIAGGFLALLFLNFCFDVAIRNVKLCFLQIIAPIPIILNIEPGDSKNKSLSWWGKECLRTYVDLFIRVATVYFGVFLINQLFGNGMTVQGSSNTSAWFKVFMILGILLFVKQIPEMIGKAFGVDMKGNFSLNPLKRLRENKLTGMMMGSAAGLVAGYGISGLYRGARLGYQGKGIAETMRSESAHAAQMRNARLNGSTFWGRTGERVNGLLGTPSASERIGQQNARFDRRIAHEQEQKRSIEDSISATRGRISDLSASADSIKALEDRAQEQTRLGKGASGAEYVRRSGEIEALKGSTLTADSGLLSKRDAAQRALSDLDKTIASGAGKKIFDANGNVLVDSSAKKRAELEATLAQINNDIEENLKNKENERGARIAQMQNDLENFVRDEGMKQYMDEAMTDPNFDKTYSNLFATAVQKSRYAGIDIDGMNASDLHSTYGQTKGTIGEEKRNIADDERRISEHDANIKAIEVERDNYNTIRRRNGETYDRRKASEANKSAIK